jgi:uncharacterized protein (DUF1778 family)
MRNVNINVRSTEEEKAMLLKAAELAGFSNLTNFIMTSARKEASRILSDIHTTYLSARDWEQVNDLINNPPPPNQKLKDLFKH